MEDTLRVQPEVSRDAAELARRKALVFSDSRQEAAQLAGDLRRDHRYDVFRQLLYRDPTHVAGAAAVRESF